MYENLQIEQAGYADVPAIFSIMEQTCSMMQNPEWYIIEDAAYLKQHVEEEGTILKAVVDGVMAGFLVIRYPKEAEDNLGSYVSLTEEERKFVAHMESAAVRPEFRGMGIQKKLMKKGEEILADTEYIYLMGTAHPDNVYSVNNFQQLGYEIVAQEKKYGGLPRYVFYRKTGLNSRN